MKTLRQQRGLTFISLLIIIALIAFFALIIMKVGPLYIENASVNASLENVVGLPDIGKEGKRAIRNRIQRQLDVDDVKSFNSKDAKIVKSKEKQVWLVTAEYEARTILFKNLGVFIDFSKTVEVPR
jgi:Tfp pilus assembly protein FimT